MTGLGQSDAWAWCRAQVDFICPACETDGGSSQATWHLDESDGWRIECPNGCAADEILSKLGPDNPMAWLRKRLAELPDRAALGQLTSQGRSEC